MNFYLIYMNLYKIYSSKEYTIQDVYIVSVDPFIRNNFKIEVRF